MGNHKEDKRTVPPPEISSWECKPVISDMGEFVEKHAKYRERMQKKTEEVFSAEGGPTLDGLTELFELGKDLPVADFTPVFKKHKERNTPEYQEAMKEAILLSPTE